MDDSSNKNLDILGEIAGILALGLQRLNARKSSLISPTNRDNPLDCEPGSHGHVQREREEIGT
jgi:hypothetical protein